MQAKLLRRALALLLLANASAAHATFVTPAASFATTEANSSFTTTGLFGWNDTTELYQIAASELASQGLVAGQQITGVRARLDGTATSPGPAAVMTWPDLTIKMAQAPDTIANMTGIFANAMVNPVTVHTGPYTLAANSLPSGSSPNAFGGLLSFTTPYTYQGGDLVFYYTHPGVVGGTVTTDANIAQWNGLVPYRSLRDTGTYLATTGLLGSNAPQSPNSLNVLQFEVAAIPEAHAPLLLASALAIATVIYKRHTS